MYNILHIMIQCFIRSNGGIQMTTNKANKSIKNNNSKNCSKASCETGSKNNSSSCKRRAEKEAVKPVAKGEKPVAKQRLQRRSERQQENREKQVKLRFARQQLLLTQKFLFRFTDRNFPSRKLWKKLWQHGKQKERKLHLLKEQNCM